METLSEKEAIVLILKLMQGSMENYPKYFNDLLNEGKLNEQDVSALTKALNKQFEVLHNNITFYSK